MEKYIKDLTANEVINVRTEEDAVQLTEKFHELGLEWCNGESYKEFNNFEDYNERTCYNPIKGKYSSKSFWEDVGATIYTIEDILDFQFTFPDKWVIKQSLSQEVCDKFKKITGVISANTRGAWRYLVYPKIGLTEHYAETIPEGYTEITVEQFKKHFLKQNNKMQTKDRRITHDQAQRIIDSACRGWQFKLSGIWAENIVLKKPIDISEEFYSEMRKACTSAQHLVFDEIFGKDKEEFNSSMLKVGEFMFVNDEGCKSNGNRIMRSYNCLVDIDSPNKTYYVDAIIKGDKIESGSVLEVKVK